MSIPFWQGDKQGLRFGFYTFYLGLGRVNSDPDEVGYSEKEKLLL